MPQVNKPWLLKDIEISAVVFSKTRKDKRVVMEIVKRRKTLSRSGLAGVVFV